MKEAKNTFAKNIFSKLNKKYFILGVSMLVAVAVIIAGGRGYAVSRRKAVGAISILETGISWT